MRTKTNAPAQAARIVTVVLVIILVAVILTMAQLNLDHKQCINPCIHGSSEQTIMPSATPGVPVR